MKDYWFRGGIGGVIVAFLFVLAVYWLGLDSEFSRFLSFYGILYPMSFYQEAFGIGQGNYVGDDYLAVAAVYFLVGSLLGWLYGKIKMRSSNIVH